MKYVRVEANLREFPNRLNRRILVRKDIDLLSFGCVVMTSLKASYQYLFHIEKDDVMYLPLTYLKGEESGRRKYIGDYLLTGVGSPFKLCYGNEYNGYEFNIIVDDSEIELEGNDIAIIEKASGMGIFEDEREDLFKYLSGELGEDPILSCYPWNLDIDNMADFDDIIDIETLNSEFSSTILEDMERVGELDDEYSSLDDIEEADEDDLLQIVNDQIEHLDFVRDAFDNLREEFGDERARSFIESAMLNEVDMMVKEDREFDLERYKEILKRLYLK